MLTRDALLSVWEEHELPSLPLMNILEALTQYLTEKGIKQIFDFLAKAIQGSRLVLTYVRKDFLDGRSLYGWEKFYKKFVTDEKVFIFGMEPDAWPDFLKKYPRVAQRGCSG